MMHKRPELDTEHPPGQIVNRPPPNFEKPLEKAIEEYEKTMSETHESGCGLFIGNRSNGVPC